MGYSIKNSSHNRQKPIKLLMTGEMFFNKQTREIALSPGNWRVRILQPSRVWPLVFLRDLLRSELWYQTSGITNLVTKLLCWAAFVFRVPHIVHWIGTDVVEARDYLPKHPLSRKVVSRIYHWTTAPWLVDELKQIGIKAEFVPYTSRVRQHYLSIEPPDFPPQFTVLTYIPDKYLEFYGWEYIIRLAHDFPEITFNILRATGKFISEKPSNVNFLGWVDDMFEIYKKCTVVVRMTKHDGYSGIIQEALALGRYAIWTYPFPGAFQAKDYPALHSYIANLLDLHQKGLLKKNEEGRQFIKQNMNPDILASDIVRKMRQCARRKEDF